MAEKVNPFGVVGQDAQLSYWDVLIQSGRYGHAHILAGNGGVGKDALAFHIAAKLNCRSEGPQPCGECQSCRQMKHFEFPGLHLVFATPRGSGSQTDPLAGLKEAEMTAINEELDRKKAWLYYHLEIDGANDIRIASIRQLRKDIYLASDLNTVRVVMILRAHKLNTEAANALLKILEEPPANTVFFLTTEYLDRLPDTIRSRCAIHHVPDLGWQHIQHYLMSHKSISAERAEIAARMSMGNLAQAMVYGGQDHRIWLDQIRGTLNALARQDFASVRKQVLRLKDPKEYTDTGRQQFLSLLILFFRDVAMELTEGDSVLWLPQVQQMNKIFPQCDSGEAIRAIEQTKDALSRKVHLQLALTALFFRLRHILKGEANQESGMTN